MLGKPGILFLFPNLLNKFNKTYMSTDVRSSFYSIIDYSSLLQTLDWLQSIKQFFINVSYYKLVASLTLMALFKKQSLQSLTGPKYMIVHIDEKLF